MGTLNTVAISPVKYRNLVAKAMPKVIETRQELRRFTDILEALDRPDRTLSPEGNSSALEKTASNKV